MIYTYDYTTGQLLLTPTNEHDLDLTAALFNVHEQGGSVELTPHGKSVKYSGTCQPNPKEEKPKE